MKAHPHSSEQLRKRNDLYLAHLFRGEGVGHRKRKHFYYTEWNSSHSFTKYIIWWVFDTYVCTLTMYLFNNYRGVTYFFECASLYEIVKVCNVPKSERGFLV